MTLACERLEPGTRPLPNLPFKLLRTHSPPRQPPHAFTLAPVAPTHLSKSPFQDKMDISGVLTPQEVALLSDPDLSLEQSLQRLQATRGSQQAREESNFENSLRLKVTLDTFEQQGTI